MKIVSTQRLILREFMLTDAADLFALNADPEVMRYTGDKPFATLAEAEALIKGYQCYRTDGYGRWTVVRSDDGAVLGWCGSRMQASGEVDLGYRLHRMFWGQGYATEAGIVCVRIGFEQFNLPRIIGRVARANMGSIRVLEKCGLHYWKEAEPECNLADAMIYVTDAVRKQFVESQ
jgi:RimJ/RimL family protein N-acetyltransferase